MATRCELFASLNTPPKRRGYMSERLRIGELRAYASA